MLASGREKVGGAGERDGESEGVGVGVGVGEGEGLPIATALRTMFCASEELSNA